MEPSVRRTGKGPVEVGLLVAVGLTLGAMLGSGTVGVLLLTVGGVGLAPVHALSSSSAQRLVATPLPFIAVLPSGGILPRHDWRHQHRIGLARRLQQPVDARPGVERDCEQVVGHHQA